MAQNPRKKDEIGNGPSMRTSISIEKEQAREKEHPSNEVEREAQQIDAEAENVPRADGGKDAWLFLASTFIVEAMIWGL